MNNAVNRRVLREDIVQCWLVGDVNFVEDGPLAADQLDAIKGDLGGIVEVVDDDDIVAVLEEYQRGEGADVASATASNNQYPMANRVLAIDSLKNEGFRV